MKTELKQSLFNKKTPLLIGFLCIISGVACGLIGEIALPLPIAFLAALYLFDNSERHKVSLATSSILFVINVAGLYFRLTFSAFAPASIILAFIIYYAFTRKQGKSDAAFLMTLVCAGFSLIGYLLIAMSIQGEYTIDAAFAFYGNLVKMLRESFVSLMLDAYAKAGVEITADLITEAFDMQLSMVISYLLIAAFLIVGLSFKLFSLVVKLCAEDKREISSWRFFTSNLFAYCYVLAGFATIFMPAYDSLLPVAVLNVYYFFMAVYAYVGFNVVFELLKKRFKPFISVILLLASLLVLSSIGTQVLAVVGVLHTIRKNNEAAFTGEQQP